MALHLQLAAREVLGADAKTAMAEITDKPALEKALKGCDSVFMVTGHGPQVAEQQIGIIDAAKEMAAAANYENLGTFEFLVDDEASGKRSLFCALQKADREILGE
jgi:hypothetical protein